ncbi:unnamed protein product [Closterium sp. Naga37s-1]|nr:unnamed protein product [Closterium sp. Naga37s-1]
MAPAQLTSAAAAPALSAPPHRTQPLSSFATSLSHQPPTILPSPPAPVPPRFQVPSLPWPALAAPGHLGGVGGGGGEAVGVGKDGSEGGAAGEWEEAVVLTLKRELLDVEAAAGVEAMEGPRGRSGRRRAWRAMVKRADTKHWRNLLHACILLELAIRADRLALGWRFWCSPAAAASCATLAALALRVRALDRAALYFKGPLRPAAAARAPPRAHSVGGQGKGAAAAVGSVEFDMFDEETAASAEVLEMLKALG